jgi:hypothetical protein
MSLERFGFDYTHIGADFDDDGLLQTAYDTITIISAGVGAVIAYPISAVFSALFLFILCKIMRGPAGFQPYFSMYAHLCIITALCGVITMWACVVFDNLLDILSLAAVFMPEGNYTNMTYNFLSAVNLPAIWTTVLLIIGLKSINEWSAAKAALAGGIAFVCSVSFAAASLGAVFFMYDWLDTLIF